MLVAKNNMHLDTLNVNLKLDSTFLSIKNISNIRGDTFNIDLSTLLNNQGRISLKGHSGVLPIFANCSLTTESIPVDISGFLTFTYD